MNDIKFAIDLYKGFEDLNNNRFDTPNGKLFLSYHYTKNNKTLLSDNKSAWMNEGYESILGTLYEAGTRMANKIGDFFNDYDKQEADRIEKEVKGGLDAWKKDSVDSAIKGLKDIRKRLVDGFNNNSPSLSKAASKKNMDMKEFKNWVLNKIDFTLMDMSNSSKKDYYYEKIKTETEDVFKSIVSRKSWLEDIVKGFKELYGDPGLFDLMTDLGINVANVKKLEERTKRLLPKYEGIAKNNYKYYDIRRANIVEESLSLTADLRTMNAAIIDHLYKLDKELAKLNNKESAILGGKDWNVRDLKVASFYVFLMVDIVNKATNKFMEETNSSLAKGWYVLTGISKEVSELLG